MMPVPDLFRREIPHHQIAEFRQDVRVDRHLGLLDRPAMLPVPLEIGPKGFVNGEIGRRAKLKCAQFLGGSLPGVLLRFVEGENGLAVRLQVVVGAAQIGLLVSAGALVHDNTKSRPSRRAGSRPPRPERCSANTVDAES